MKKLKEKIRLFLLRTKVRIRVARGVSKYTRKQRKDLVKLFKNRLERTINNDSLCFFFNEEVKDYDLWRRLRSELRKWRVRNNNYMTYIFSLNEEGGKKRVKVLKELLSYIE